MVYKIRSSVPVRHLWIARVPRPRLCLEFGPEAVREIDVAPFSILDVVMSVCDVDSQDIPGHEWFPIAGDARGGVMLTFPIRRHLTVANFIVEVE